LASLFTSAASCDHDSVCQMPYSFSRNAGASGRAVACSNSKRGKVVCTAVVSDVTASDLERDARKKFDADLSG
jgi:hypothetical protein